MRIVRDLGSLPWRLSPSVPYLWQFQPFATLDDSPEAEPIPARVPGSVQRCLRDAGILPDWNVGRQARACEWVENRHWIYETVLPAGWFAPRDAAHGAGGGRDAPAEPRNIRRCRMRPRRDHAVDIRALIDFRPGRSRRQKQSLAAADFDLQRRLAPEQRDGAPGRGQLGGQL